MSGTIQHLHRSLRNLISLSVSHIALNPVVTAALLWIITKGPPALKDRLFSRVTALRDPYRLARIVKALKWLLALGLVGSANKELNRIALNAWRIKSDRKRWNNLSQEIAVVTGGCSGIGALIVKGLNKKGVTVAVLDVQQLPQSLQGYANIKFFACDITDPKAVKDTAERIRSTLGSPSILVNNAGVASLRTILDTSHEQLQQIFNVNVISNWTTVKAFLPDMVTKNKGHIVTIASLASFISAAGMTDYCATKSAVLAFHEGLNQELRVRYNAPNVITTSIHPNWVRTPLVERYVEAIRKQGSHLIEPQAVAEAVIKQIVDASGGQILLPARARSVSLLRGYPNWMQEAIRTPLGRAIVSTAP